MKILIITHYNFGIESGGATNRILELAKVMSKYSSIEIVHQGPNMRVKNLSFVGYEPIFPFNRPHWISRAAGPYVSYAFPDFYRVVKEVVDGVDVVQVEQPYLFTPTLMVMKTLNKNPFIVLDEHNVDFASVKSKINGISLNSLLTTVTLPYVFLSENLAVKSAKLVLCVSHADRELLVKLYGIPESKVLVVPNGVNLSKFEETHPINNPVLKNPYTVFFHGTLSWYPNIEAASIIVDYVAPKVP
ncbi:MAG: glycosyltransferase, partial [Candidatus Baldrarchaeia archaeon]